MGKFLVLLTLLFFVIGAAPPVRAQSSELLKSFQKYQVLHKAGKYRQAIPHLEKLVELATKEFGPNHQLTLVQTNNLASLYESQGRYLEAEPLYLRVLNNFEKGLGPDHLNVATSLNNLAGLYRQQGRFGKVQPLYARALAIREKQLGQNHADVAQSLNNLAAFYESQGRYFEAEPLYRRALKIYQKVRGADHPDTAAILNNFAEFHSLQGRYLEAEPLFRRALKIYEKTKGADHPDVGRSLNNLAGLYDSQRRYKDAEPLYKRALSMREKVLGADHPDVATSLNNLAALYERQKRHGEAEPLYKRSLKISEKALGQSHVDVATSLNNLAAHYRAREHYREAEPLYLRALQIYAKAFGADHPLTANSVSNLAELYHADKRDEKAVLFYLRALETRKKVLGPDHPDVALTLNNLAVLYFAQSNWPKASNYWRQATKILTLRDNRRAQRVGKSLTGKSTSEVSRNSWFFWGLVKSAYRSSPPQNMDAELMSDLFETAQSAIGSQAAGALAQMSARQAKGKPALVTLVRERQDKVGEWQSLDKQLIAWRSKPIDKRNKSEEQKLATRLSAIDKRITIIDEILSKDFPDYAELSSPKPLSITQVQKWLGPDEALIMLLDTRKAKPTPAETFVWAITRQQAVLKRAEIGGKQLSRKIAILRKVLDPSTATRSAKKQRGFAPSTANSSTDSGFNLAVAHELYQKLLGPVADTIKDKKHLMVVASGPLTALPLQVLIKTKSSDLSDKKYLKADWLIRHYAITTLPSVSSLKALRSLAGTARPAPRPLIGFADPVFRQLAAKPKKIDSSQRGYASFFRGRGADLVTLSRLPPLPGTKRELREVGKLLKVSEKNLLFGRSASERAVKNAALERFRIIYFATHGLVAGDIQGLGEPALAFSLPPRATLEDDGLLTASEITSLKMNADWVVMSACNTAAGDKPGAEALSGLARAFFYAGARTLLVSHWPVGDKAAVKLTTHAFLEMSNDPKLGRSEALRRSMLVLLNEGGEHSHPSSWAPFVVVGEGATR